MSNTGEHTHCYCQVDTIGRIMCCICGAVLEGYNLNNTTDEQIAEAETDVDTRKGDL